MRALLRTSNFYFPGGPIVVGANYSGSGFVLGAQKDKQTAGSFSFTSEKHRTNSFRALSETLCKLRQMQVVREYYRENSFAGGGGN